MDPYRISHKVESGEYNGHFFAISRINLKGKIQYNCLCIHCGKSIKISKSSNMLFNPAYRIHFRHQCPQTVRFIWKKEKPMEKLKKEIQKEYWTWLPYLWTKMNTKG